MSYEGLPQMTGEVDDWLDEAIKAEIKKLKTLDKRLAYIDREMDKLRHSNSLLAITVEFSIKQVERALGWKMDSELDRVNIRTVGYLNAIILLRGLDMAYRRQDAINQGKEAEWDKEFQQLVDEMKTRKEEDEEEEEEE